MEAKSVGRWSLFPASASHELAIEGPGPGDVVGPLDDGPAVGEDGELVPLGGEAEHEGVVADRAQGREPGGHLGEVQGLGAAGGNLDGIPAAEGGRVRALGARQPLELAPTAAGTVHLA